MIEFIRDVDKLLAAKALLSSFGEEAVLALPLPLISTVLLAHIERIENEIDILKRRILTLEQASTEVWGNINQLTNIKIDDVSTLKTITSAISKSPKYSKMGQTTITNILTYSTDEITAKVLETEIQHAQRMKHSKANSLAALQHVYYDIDNFTSFIEEVRQLIEFLNRHNISVSYIINLEQNKLIEVLEKVK